MLFTNSNSAPNSPARLAGLYLTTFSPLHRVGPTRVGPSSVKVATITCPPLLTAWCMVST